MAVRPKGSARPVSGPLTLRPLAPATTPIARLPLLSGRCAGDTVAVGLRVDVGVRVGRGVPVGPGVRVGPRAGVADAVGEGISPPDRGGVAVRRAGCVAVG